MATALATRLPRSLQSRLLLTYLALMVLGVGGLILWTGQRLQAAAVEQAEHNLELEAFIIADALREPLDKWAAGKKPDGRSLESLVHSYAQSTGGRVTVTDARLQVLFSSDERVPLHREENHQEFVAARAGWEQHNIRWDEWSGEERLFVAAAVTEEDRTVIGFVQLSVPMAPIYAQIRQIWLSLFAAGSVVVLVTALVSLLLAYQIAHLVKTLTAAIEEIAAGRLEQQVTPAGPDEIQRLGRAFNRMAERVREMMARQQAFVANAAHELRSPLTSLRLRLEMLQTHAQGDGELTQHYLRQMEREVDHLRRLVDHLLALSTLDEGESLPRTSLDLAPLLYALADEMGPLARQAGLDLHVDVPSHLPAVMANAEQMRIVIRNILDNAIKYTPSGGQITLQARTDYRLPAAASNGTGGGTQPAAVLIGVADTGIGIPAEALPHIFERFYRVDNARSRRQGGAGLGLALVETIVKAHGGQVDVKSQPGRGSVFTVLLPTSPPLTLQREPAFASRRGPLIRRRS